MNKFIKVSLYLLVALSISTSSYANSFKAKIANISSKLTKSSNLAFNIYSPGIGRTKIILRKKTKNLPTIIDADQLRNDSFALFSGKSKNKNSENLVAASIFEINSKKILLLSIPTQNRFSKNVFQKVIFNLNPDYSLEDNIGKVIRVKRLSKNLENCHDSEEIPTIPKTTRLSTLNQTINKKILTLEIDSDHTWYKLFGRSSAALILSIINEAEVIYSKQLNIVFKINKVKINKKPVLNPTYPELTAYRKFKETKSSKETSNAYHMFLGRKLSNGAIGLGYLGAACRNAQYSVGLTRYTNLILTPITFAHEIGHNLGATHSNGKSSIMSASIGTDPSSMYFSNSSVFEMLEFFKNNGSCINEKQIKIKSSVSKRIRLKTNLSSSGIFTSVMSNLDENKSCRVKLYYKYRSRDKNYSFDDYKLFKNFTTNSSSIVYMSKINPNFEGKIYFKTIKFCKGVKAKFSSSQTIRGKSKVTYKNVHKVLKQIRRRI